MRLFARPAAASLLALIVLAGGCIGRVTDSSAPIDQLAPGHWMGGTEPGLAASFANEVYTS